MATRFRLTADTTAPAVSPALSIAYTHATPSTVRRQLKLSDSSALSTFTYSPDAVDHLVAGTTLLGQWVSEPMDAGVLFSLGDVLKYALQASETDAADNNFLQVIVFVVSEDGSTVRATLRARITQPTEPTTTLTNRAHSTTQSGANYTTLSGDRIVVEYDFSGTPVAAGGVQGHNGSIRLGGAGASDLPEDITDTTTTKNPWIEFAPTIKWKARTGAGGTLSSPASLTQAGLKGGKGSGSVTGTAALTQAGRKGGRGSGSVSTSAALTQAGRKAGTGAGALSTAAALTQAGRKAGAGVGVLTGSAALTQAGLKSTAGAGTLSSPAALTSAATKAAAGAGSIAAVPAFNDTAQKAGSGAGDELELTASFAFSSYASQAGGGSLSMSPALTGAGAKGAQSGGSLSGSLTLSAEGARGQAGSGVLVLVMSFSATGTASTEQPQPPSKPAGIYVRPQRAPIRRRGSGELRLRMSFAAAGGLTGASGDADLMLVPRLRATGRRATSGAALTLTIAPALTGAGEGAGETVRSLYERLSELEQQRDELELLLALP